MHDRNFEKIESFPHIFPMPQFPTDFFVTAYKIDNETFIIPGDAVNNKGFIM